MSNIQKLRTMSAEELGKLFEEATRKAALETLAAGRCVTGLDEAGRIVRVGPNDIISKD